MGRDAQLIILTETRGIMFLFLSSDVNFERDLFHRVAWGLSN